MNWCRAPEKGAVEPGRPEALDELPAGDGAPRGGASAGLLDPHDRLLERGNAQASRHPDQHPLLDDLGQLIPASFEGRAGCEHAAKTGDLTVERPSQSFSYRALRNAVSTYCRIMSDTSLRGPTPLAKAWASMPARFRLDAVSHHAITGAAWREGTRVSP
jgi:hypothetical protein